MSDRTTYQEYAGDRARMATYADYQARYSGTIRESDRVLIGHVERLVNEADARGQLELLDVGCSTGNLLLHLKQSGLPLTLSGADLAADVLSACRENPALEGMDFYDLDVVAERPAREFDLIVFSAVFFAFGRDEFAKAVANTADALRPGGALVCFDLFHPFDQELDIVETSPAHTGGLRIVMRGYEVVREAFAAAGLGEPEFHPFRIPIDLPGGDDPASIQTYTIRDDAAQRLCFRGSLFQPWCHTVAHKA